MSMGRLEFGRLTAAWKGEATDFTPLLAEQLDNLGQAIGVDMAAVGECEVYTAGGRRIDIVANGADGSEFVIENQYGIADHDHLTRGLAYAVARHARGLIVVAEEHRDEFRAVAQYLNDLAEADSERGILIWLVEARAVRIGDSLWAPLFTTVTKPNAFTATVEQAKQSDKITFEQFYAMLPDPGSSQAAQQVVQAWQQQGMRSSLGKTWLALQAPGPSGNGYRVTASIYPDGSIGVPFSAYAGANSGIPIGALTTEEFRSSADTLFGFTGKEKVARTAPGWLQPDRAGLLLQYCAKVADAYRASQNAPAPRD